MIASFWHVPSPQAPEIKYACWCPREIENILPLLALWAAAGTELWPFWPFWAEKLVRAPDLLAWYPSSTA